MEVDMKSATEDPTTASANALAAPLTKYVAGDVVTNPKEAPSPPSKTPTRN